MIHDISNKTIIIDMIPEIFVSMYKKNNIDENTNKNNTVLSKQHLLSNG
jgi:hypothetical protein